MRFLFAVLLGLTCACAPEHAALGRPYELRVPAGAAADEALPLIILAHGYAANGQIQNVIFPFSDQVDAKRFLYAMPNGTQDRYGRRFWDATDACCNFDSLPVDDVAFFRALIDDVKATHPVLPGKVFVVGHSNGGFMALRLACEASDVVDGVAAVSGSTWWDSRDCPSGRAIPLLLVHGVEDDVIFYEGRADRYPSAHETGRRFARRAGCNGSWVDGERADFEGDSATLETRRETIEGCAPAIELWSLDATGHVPSFDGRWTSATIDWLQGHTP